MNFFSDKVVIITGSSMGIGKTTARQLLKLGANVVINARSSEKLAETYNELQTISNKLFAVQGDISNYEDCKNIIQKTVDTFGKLDILINNAGNAMLGNVEEIDIDIFKKVTEVNFLGSVYMTKLAIPYLKQTKGNVLFVSSVAAIHGIPGYAVYSSTKIALQAFAQSLRIELQDYGIAVSIAYVGFTENDPQKTIYDSNGKIIKMPSRAFIKQQPVETVAKKLLNLIEKRKFKAVFTFLGKINNFIYRISPAIIRMVLTNSYKKGVN